MFLYPPLYVVGHANIQGAIFAVGKDVNVVLVNVVGHVGMGCGFLPSQERHQEIFGFWSS